MFLKNKKNKYAGFSLMEMLVAIFIFSLMMVTVTAIFISVSNARKKAKAIQKDVEDVRFAMEQMAKTLRTSTVWTPETSSQTISVYDHSQLQCFQYQISADKLQSKSGVAQVNANNEVISCNNTGTWADMSGASVSDLRFAITQTTNGIPTPPPVVGKVTIMMKVCYNNVCTGSAGDQAIIQTTVSLRDYEDLKP